MNVMIKNPINPKEKSFLKERMARIAQNSDDPEAQFRIRKSYALADAARLKRCRAAVGKQRIGIPVNDRIVEYYPSTGKILWAVHPALEKIGEPATHTAKNGLLVIGKISAARLVHEAVHGPLPDNHEVYCINNDPANLSIYNLRSRDTKRDRDARDIDQSYQRPSQISDEDRENIRLAREEVKRRRMENGAV